MNEHDDDLPEWLQPSMNEQRAQQLREWERTGRVQTRIAPGRGESIWLGEDTE